MNNNISRDDALRLLNAPDRLENLKQLVHSARTGLLPLPTTGTDVNNHIHTTYSFSPYSPTAAVWFAWQSGLCTAGIMDHDSIAGASEFIQACDIVGIGGTIGIECRVDMSATPFSHNQINNPDQKGIMYTCMHGVPHDQAQYLNDAFAPYREKRNDRNRKMVASVNSLMSQYDIHLDFDRDVLPLSEYANGGTVTERHLSSALATKMIEKTGGGQPLVTFVRTTLNLPMSEKIETLLLDPQNPYMMYDLLGWIKSELISKFYIDSTDELMDVKQFVALSHEIGAVCANAYLGDVIGESITGDKKTQKFEDDFLDELLKFVKDLGYQAVTYGPSRNTKTQFERLKSLCQKYDFMQVSGEDINTPRQSFVCVAQRDPSFANLSDAAWALIAHERMTKENGLFSAKTIEKWPDLESRVKAFADYGRNLTHPNT